MIAGSRLAASMLAVALVGGGLVARAVGSRPVSSPRIEIEGDARVIALAGIADAALRRLAANPPAAREWSDAFALYVDDSSAANDRQPSVLATYEVDDDRVRLVPRFPLTPGVSYRTRVVPGALARLLQVNDVSRWKSLDTRFTMPTVRLERTTRITGLHPSSGTVPANLLRWYIEFSAPMEPGSALEHVHLLDASGNDVRHAFLAGGEELWSPDRRRLTLLFDPGRVKRGIRTNLESGAPLIEGRRYTLSIDGAWRDGRGAALTSGFDHAFQVTSEDRESPAPSGWSLHEPRATTREPLRVSLGEPLDHALVSRTLRVTRDGAIVRGRAIVGEGDSTWSFVPDEPWVAGAMSLEAEPILEDLAGNSIARVFDADITRQKSERSAHRVAFVVH